MHRFFIPSPKITKKLITINDHRIIFQISKVLRMWKGDKFNIFDEKGEEHTVEIIDMNKRKIIGNILEKIKNHNEPKLKVSLYQAIPKKPALFEWVIQKATEIGVTEIYPLITERTEKRKITKFDRLYLIAMEAAEQCGRLKIPTIHHPVVLEDELPKLSNGFIAYEYEQKKFLSDYDKELYKNDECQIIIGPEGGLSQKEIEITQKSKVKPFTFGNRILRTETAAIAALSQILLQKNK